MWKLFLGMAFAAFVQSAWSSCPADSTIILKTGTPGFTAGNGSSATATYDPKDLNAYIHGCAEGTITVHLNIDAAEAGKTKDTVKLTSPILIGGRAGKTTSINMDRPSSVPATTLDTLFTFTESSTTNPLLLVDSLGNTMVLARMAFARKVLNQGENTINIMADNSIVTGCHFWTADKDGSALGALVNVGASLVLVERSLFRAPANVTGWALAIKSVGAYTRLEARANVFFGTGVYLSTPGPFHIIANTFAGSRNGYNPISIGSTLGTNFDNAVIMHNLFALKVDTIAPIVFNSSTAVTTDSLLRNAWTQGKTNPALAITEPITRGITIRGATGVNVNMVLPRGFSNYGPNSGDVKDYPLTELRTDSTLARKNPDFGKIYSVFLTGSWAGTPISMSDVSTYASKMYFQVPGFAPFMPGKSWLPNIKVGAFVDQDTITVPSPLLTGAQGASLKMQRDTSSTDKAKITAITFDPDYYKQTIQPEYAYFFFSNSLAKLTASNDTSALIAAGNPGFRRSWTGFDNILSVPKEVRNGPTVDIYVKMLHFRGSYQAPVLSNAAIATLSNFPGYPVNDLTLTNSPPNNLNMTVDIRVIQGGEQIDSIRILTLNESGQQVASVNFAATSPLNKTIKVDNKGRYFLQAVPVAKIGTGVYKAGSPTASVGPIDIGLSTSDTVYVTYTGAACAGADGSQPKPYCILDSALKVVGAKNGGTIIINPGTVPMVDVSIDSLLAPGSGGITIASGHFDETRPVFLGATKEALTISRKNITLRGFTFEQPAGATKAAVVVNAGGCLIDANIFRAHTKGSVDAPAIKVSIGATADSRIINNVVWGFAKAVQLSATSSPNLKIMFNTFVADTAVNKTPTSGISTVTPDSVSAVIADNFFSGLTDPIDQSLTGKTPILDHNVYTAGANLHGLSESGGLGPSTPVGTKDIWVAKYTAEIEKALLATVDCSSLSPCNPLYGGSSDNNYSVTVATDVFGKARKNRKEVGAYEYPSGPSSVLGVVEIHPALIPGTFRQIAYTVSGKSFDPDKDESDSVQVFWLTSDITHSVDAALSVVPASQRKTYPITKLVAGNITDTADGIGESTKYWFYAALSRNTSGRVMGYAYSDTVFSNANLLYDSCTFKDSKSACPSQVGVFGVKDGSWAGKFETRVLLTQPTESGLVRVPKFITATNTSLYNLDLSAPLPMFSLDATVPGLGTDTSKQRLTWQVQVYFSPDVLTGYDLFLLPNDSGGKATLVPDWSIESLGGGKYSINFQSTVNGPQTYAFGKLQASPGAVMQSENDSPIYDFDIARDSSEYPVQIKIKGAGFKTANPLLLISTVPAGGTVYPTSDKVPRVISANYPVKTLAASAGYSKMTDSLRSARMYELYMRAAAAEKSTPPPKGQRKPFVLDTSLTFIEFSKAVRILPGDLDLSGGEMMVKVPVGQLFKDEQTYQDGIGKGTRSLELVITVFDGSLISRTRGFIRTRFRNKDILPSEFYNKWKWYSRSTHDEPHWNLFGFPWDESDSGSLARIVGKDKWDHDNMRLMQYQGTGEGAANYIAYDGTNASSFKYDSGMAVWSGSTGRYVPASLVGMSLDYQPFKMSLSPNRYYDISLPFNFPMKWQDILDSSLIPATNAPFLWRYNDTAAKWIAILPGASSPPTPAPVLYPWEGYTIKSSTPLNLTFPVADTSRTTTPSAKAAADGSWAVKVEARDASAAMDLRIGRGAREMLFPEAPDVPGQDFRVSLLKGDEKVSEFIQPMAGDWQGQWSLRAAVSKGAGGLSLRIGESTREIPVWLADAAHLTAVPLSKDQALTLSEADLQANDYHLVAGGKDYLDQVLKGLRPAHLLSLSNYPNPFTGSTLIRYALPEGFGRTSFALKVRDFRGRTVWEKTIEAGNSLSYTWDGHDHGGMPLPAGIYSLSLTAKAEGKPVYRAVRNLLRM